MAGRQYPWVLAEVPWSSWPEYTRGTHRGLPLLSWGIAPRDKLATYRQLRARGLRPGGHDPVAYLYFTCLAACKKTFAALYLIADAQPVRAMTPGKWAGVAAALAARRVCPGSCGDDAGEYIRRSVGMCTGCEYSAGLWDARDIRHDYVLGEPTVAPTDLAAVAEVFFREGRGAASRTVSDGGCGMKPHRLLLLPLVVVWSAIELLAVPVALIAVSWWLLPDSWARLVTVVVAAYVFLVLWLFRTVLRGTFRSMARGPVVVRRSGRARRGRSRR